MKVAQQHLGSSRQGIYSTKTVDIIPGYTTKLRNFCFQKIEVFAVDN